MINMPKLLIINVALNWGSTGRIAEQVGSLAKDNGWNVMIAHGARYQNPTQFSHYQVSSSFEEKMHWGISQFWDGQGRGSWFATKRLLKEIENRCLKLGIFVNMKKTHIYKISGWLTWLKINYKLKNTGGIIRKIHSSSIRRERRRLKKFQKAWKQGSMNLASIKQCYRSWRGSYAKYDSTEKLRKIDKYFKELFEEAEQNERDGN